MLRIIFGIAVVAQTCKHGAVVHVVTVYQGVLIAEVGRILAVDKDSAVGIILTAEQMIQIGEVVLGVGNGVIDNGVGTVDPAGGLGVFGL